LVGERGSRSAPSASGRSRSPSKQQRVAQPSQSSSSSKRSSIQTRAPAPSRRQSAAPQQRTTTGAQQARVHREEQRKAFAQAKALNIPLGVGRPPAALPLSTHPPDRIQGSGFRVQGRPPTQARGACGRHS
jgi:hypothetical protein